MFYFLQEIYRDDYKLWVQVILRNKVSHGGRLPAIEILKLCFRITNISSGTFLITSADISSYPELLFVLKLANAFSSS